MVCVINAGGVTLPKKHRKPSAKSLINRLIDSAIHPKGTPDSLGAMLVDEALHSAVEGRWRPEKFMRYTVLPNMMKRRRK